MHSLNSPISVPYAIQDSCVVIGKLRRIAKNCARFQNTRNCTKITSPQDHDFLERLMTTEHESGRSFLFAKRLNMSIIPLERIQMIRTFSKSSTYRICRPVESTEKNYRGALSQPHSVRAEIETPKASRGRRRGEGRPLTFRYSD